MYQNGKINRAEAQRMVAQLSFDYMDVGAVFEAVLRK
jgi:hypothetical protein